MRLKTLRNHLESLHSSKEPDIQPRFSGPVAFLFKKLASKEGFGLVEILVAVGILGIAMTIMITFLTNQMQETKALSEKLSTLDATRSIATVLANPTACSALFAAPNLVNASQTTIDATNASTANPVVIELKSVPASGVSLGQPASAISSLPLIASIKAMLISPSQAYLLVDVNQGQLVRKLKPLKFNNINLQTSGPLNALSVTGCGTNASGGIAYIVDQKPSGTDAGDCTPSTWSNRNLNTVAFDTGIGASVAGNLITLPAGSYLLTADAPVEAAGYYQIRLQDVTANSTVALGSSTNSSNNYDYTAHSHLVASFTLNAPASLAIQHWCQTIYHGGYSVGHAVSNGSPEIYATVLIQKQ